VSKKPSVCPQSPGGLDASGRLEKYKVLPIKTQIPTQTNQTGFPGVPQKVKSEIGQFWAPGNQFPVYEKE